MIESDGYALLRWIPLLPLLAAAFHGVLLALVRRPISKGLVVVISCGSVLASFLLSCLALGRLIQLPQESRVLTDGLYTWIGSGSFSAELSFLLDPLSAVMILVVTGVGSLIHIYSIGYMEDDDREDRGFQRFFCYLNLFTFSMLVLVLGDNLVLMFLGWEGVGLCSYLLIGFWYGDRFYAYCGSKAFIVNRIGDFGFLLGIFLLFWALADAGAASVAFRDLGVAFVRIAEQTVALPAWLQWLPGAPEWGLPTLIGLCFFLGAAGKSAQIPLYTWLPDAMAGPTPVSALIHAATMVTAGVYMVCRLSFLYAAAPGASAVIAWTGAVTALFAATIALAQTDIKKVLAYSTVSQLGYMFLAAGCGAYGAAMFHVVTHAFFKALLFLGAGAVILALHHEQDMRKMGGLMRHLPWTAVWMACGVIGISAVPYVSAGFFSKDEILLSAYLAEQVPGHLWLYGIGVVTGGLTAFYMFRLFFFTFLGNERATHDAMSHAHDPGKVILVPLAVLAALSLFGGYLGPAKALVPFVPDSYDPNSLGRFLAPVFQGAALTLESAGHGGHHVSHAQEFGMAMGAFGVAAVGILLAWLLYVWRPELPARIAGTFSAVHATLVHKYWVDELYDRVLVRPLVVLSDEVLFRGIDQGVIDGAGVNGPAQAIRSFTQDILRQAQSGLAQGYLLTMVVGGIVLIGWLVR